MRKILVVEDEEEILEEVKGFFGEEGFQVFAASTGREGIRVLREQSPDIVLIDLKLPDISGLEVLKEAKSHFPETRTVVNTGYVDQSLADAAESSGCDVFLHKPFDLCSLKGEIEKLLSFNLGKVR